MLLFPLFPFPTVVVHSGSPALTPLPRVSCTSAKFRASWCKLPHLKMSRHFLPYSLLHISFSKNDFPLTYADPSSWANAFPSFLFSSSFSQLFTSFSPFPWNPSLCLQTYAAHLLFVKSTFLWHCCFFKLLSLSLCLRSNFMKGNYCLYVPSTPFLICPFQNKLWSLPSIPVVDLDTHWNHLGPRTHFQMFWCSFPRVWLKPGGASCPPHICKSNALEGGREQISKQKAV